MRHLSPEGLIFRALAPDLTLRLSCSPASHSCTMPLIIQNVDGLNTQVFGEAVTVKHRHPLSLWLELQLDSGASTAVRLAAPQQMPFSFVVLGDLHGRTETLQMLPSRLSSLADRPLWLMLVGDLTQSGNLSEYHAVCAALEDVGLPVYAIPGDHDLRDNGLRWFTRLFGPAFSSFSYAGIRFLLLDTSTGLLDERQGIWLSQELDANGRKLVFTHFPLFDPRGKGAQLISPPPPQLAARLAAGGVEATFSGHIHMYHRHEREGVQHVISGGGGSPPYARPDEGGYYHFSVVRVDQSAITVQPMVLQMDPAPGLLGAVGRTADATFALDELRSFPVTSGWAYCTDASGGPEAEGLWAGVAMTYLVDELGGMAPADVLVATTADGQEAIFYYDHIYSSPDAPTPSGRMILAHTVEGRSPPDLEESCSIVFLGQRSPSSTTGRVLDQYLSASARCLHRVVHLLVKSGSPG